MRGLVETVMGWESKGVKETHREREREREKCGNYGIEKSEIAALAFGRVFCLCRVCMI